MGKYITVYCASSQSLDRIYYDSVFALGRELALSGYGLIFGGGDKGLMGSVARGAKSAGGEVRGVAPSFFNVDGILYEDCDELIYTETMRERKQLMEYMAEGFIVAPGGIGTYDELFDILTLKQLGRHDKPIVLLNINGCFDALLAMIDYSAENGFLKPACKQLYHVSEDAADAVGYIKGYKPAGLTVTQLKNIAIDRR